MNKFERVKVSLFLDAYYIQPQLLILSEAAEGDIAGGEEAEETLPETWYARFVWVCWE